MSGRVLRFLFTVVGVFAEVLLSLRAGAQPPPAPPPDQDGRLDVLVGLVLILGVAYGFRVLCLKRLSRNKDSVV